MWVLIYSTTQDHILFYSNTRTWDRGNTAQLTEYIAKYIQRHFPGTTVNALSSIQLIIP
jgi:hypothetical protein